MLAYPVVCITTPIDAITVASMDQTSVSGEKEGSDILDGNEEEEGSDASADEEPGLELLVAGKSLEEVRGLMYRFLGLLYLYGLHDMNVVFRSVRQSRD